MPISGVDTDLGAQGPAGIGCVGVPVVARRGRADDALRRLRWDRVHDQGGATGAMACNHACSVAIKDFRFGRHSTLSAVANLLNVCATSC